MYDIDVSELANVSGNLDEKKNFHFKYISWSLQVILWDYCCLPLSTNCAPENSVVILIFYL